MRVSSANDRQSVNLQRDVLVAAGVELKGAGLTAMPGVKVASRWIIETPASFECRRHITLELGKSRQIIMGEIICAHFREGAVDERLHVDPGVIGIITHLGGDTCSTIRDRFDMLTPKL